MPVWLRIVWATALLNFASFWIVASMHGGDAANGKEEGGRYFVANHGRYTEVTRSYFEYSRIHSLSIWITHPIAILGAFWFVSRKRDVAV